MRIFTTSIFSIVLVISSFGAFNASKALAAPTLVSAVASNTGGTAAKEAGDSIVLEFSEATTKFAVTADNIDSVLDLNNSHSFLDGAGAIGSASWNTAGTKLTVVLSAATSLPSVVVGDTVTISGNSIENAAGDDFVGSKAITGSFVSTSGNGNDDDEDDDEDCVESSVHVSSDSEHHGNGHGGDDEDENEDEDNDSGDDDSDDGEEDHCGSSHHQCDNLVVNGKLYQVAGEPTVYLASHCTLKPFRGEAVFHARGLKFQNIIVISALPTGVTLSPEPVLPVEGTLVKGSDKTVWFVGHDGKRRGFVNADVFNKLGFKFGQVQTISDSDLGELPVDTESNIADDSHHPDGALIKCSNSPAVYVVVGGDRKPFASAEAFEGNGHSFEHILTVDCNRFAYHDGTPVTE